jgi:subtilisin
VNFSALLHSLHEDIHAYKGSAAAPNQIIRFRNKLLYEQFTAHLNRLMPSLSKLSSVKPVKMINAFICSLRSPAKLAKYSDFLSVERDVRIKVSASSLPALMPRHKSGFRSVPAGQSVPWGVKKVKAPGVWNRSIGSNVKIGVIDTGVDYSHPDLRACLSRGVNIVYPSSPAFDDNGHGTHITGTIAAANSGLGIDGIAPGATVYPVKAFDHNGSAYVSDIILGIDWCVLNRMHIINMSFGMKEKSKALQDAIMHAYRSGVIVVASSGNDGKRVGIDYPAKLPYTVSVGATTKAKKIAPFSSRGKRIDIYAPGDKIVSAWPGGKYNVLSGTSMATAHVSGVIALILAAKGQIKLASLKAGLKATAVPLSETSVKSGAGRGQIHAVRAFKYLTRTKRFH